MQFKTITNEILKSCLSGLLMKNYKRSYEEFSKFVNLEISEEQFEDFKKREITIEEINKIVEKTKVNASEEVKRLKKIWEEKEEKIVATMNELTEIGVDTAKITCYADPYQKGGYYGEDNITVGTYKNPEDVLFVIAHELFHVFYWRKLAELRITESVMGKEKLYEWELTEVIVHLLQTEDKMRAFWPTIEIEIYPEIKETQNKVKKLWEENSFEVFLVKAYELLKNEQK